MNLVEKLNAIAIAMMGRPMRDGKFTADEKRYVRIRVAALRFDPNTVYDDADLEKAVRQAITAMEEDFASARLQLKDVSDWRAYGFMGGGCGGSHEWFIVAARPKFTHV